MKENILVIGGTGFIGYHVLKNLSSKNYILFSLSKNKIPKKKRLDNVIYLFSDITNSKLLKKVLSKNFDHVINLSGYIDHSNKKQNLRCHYLGSKNIIDIFKLRKIQTFIQIGSSLEYGNLRSPQKEIKNCKPVGWYGISKYKASKYLKKTSKVFHLPYIILRPYQVYGPKQKINRLIPQTINSCLKNKIFKCTPGLQKRDFIYVDDFVNLIKNILQQKKIRCETFNIGTGKPVTVKHVINKIKDMVNLGKPIFGGIKMRNEETMSLYPSIKKVSKLLNWKPRVKLSQGLKKTIKYYSKNQF